MSDNSDDKRLTLGDKLNLSKQGSKIIRQNLTIGKSKNVAVEIRKKRKSKLQQTPSSGLKGIDLTQDELAGRVDIVKKSLKQDQEASTVEKKAEVQNKAPIIESVEASLVTEKERDIKKRQELHEKDRTKKELKTDKSTEPPKKTKALDVEKRKSKKVNLAEYRDLENIEDSDDQNYSVRYRKKARFSKPKASTTNTFIVREVTIPSTIVVSELANRMAIRAGEVVKKLMKHGVMVTVNKVIDGDIAEIICTEFGHKVKRVFEDDVEKILTEETVNEDTLKVRAPVVTIMGHVDHGKTSLLDTLRKTSITASEAGGITQHIGAYRLITKDNQSIVFIDTPGHKAFSSMRARGARLTDIVVLIVAGDDGIKEQTIEAIDHAKAAKVPIIVAVNKMDLPNADASRVCNELLQYEVVPEAFGGDVIVVEISAKTGLGLEKLEEAILLQAEIMDLKATANKKATGAVIESSQEKGRGTVATLLVQEGTLRVGDIILAGKTHGKIKLILDDHDRSIKEAGPSTPVRVLGLNEIPYAGDMFHVVKDEQTAISIAENRVRKEKEAKEAQRIKGQTGDLSFLLQSVADSEQKVLSVIVKGDVHGSVEAIKQSVEKLSDDKVKVNILHESVGAISESDINLAKASEGVIVAFNVRANAKARDLAKQEGVKILYHSIIYNVIDDIEGIIKGFHKPVIRDKFIGYAEIRKVFSVSKVGKVAGCMVTEGMVQRGAKVRLLRDNVVIHEGKLKTLKRYKDEVKEAKSGYECGMAFENYNDIKEGDIIECSIEEES